MSIKIWEAWRIPLKQLNNFMLLVNEATHNQFYENLDEWMERIDLSEAKKLREKRETEWRETCERKGWALPQPKGDKTYLWEKWELLLREIRKASDSLEKTLFGADASLNIWLDKRYAYIIPIGKVKLPNPLPEWVEDYHYQNQVDRPENTTPQQYGARCKKWHKLCLEDHNRTRLNHEIISFATPYYFHYSFLAEVHLGIVKLGKEK
jgi:hypothetical protein